MEDGWNVLVGCDRDKLMDAIYHFSPDKEQNEFFGQGHSGEIISGLIKDFLA